MKPDEATTHPVVSVLERLAARLSEVRRRRVRNSLLRSFLEAFAVHGFLLPAAGAYAALNPLDSLGLKLVLVTWFVYLWVPVRMWSLRRRGRFAESTVAIELDRLNPEAPDVFRTVLSRDRHGATTRAALETYFASWEPRLRTPRETIGRWRAGAAALAVAALVGIPVLVSPFLPPESTRGAGEVHARMWLPVRAWRAIPAPHLSPRDIPAVLMRGDSLVVRVRAEHVAKARAVYVHWVGAAGETRYAMTRGDSGLLSYAFGPAVQDFALRFSTAGHATRRYRVRVVDPPRLASFRVTVIPPAYTGLKAERLPDMPRLLSVVPGTRLSGSARSSRELDRLTATWKTEPEGDKRADRISVRGQGDQFEFTTTVYRAGDLSLGLFATAGSTPLRGTEGPFRVEVVRDAPPEITLTSPAGEQVLARTLNVPVEFQARDDFGVSKVRLHYAVWTQGGSQSEGRAGNLDITAWLGRGGVGTGTWDARVLETRFRMEAGESVELWLEAIDNDAVSGPKSSFSARARLRLPTQEEVRAAVESGERDAAVNLRSALEREKRLQREGNSPDKGASSESANPGLTPGVPEWEIRRVMSDQPRQHLRDLQQQLEAEIHSAAKKRDQAQARGDRKQAAESERTVKALQELRREAQAQEKRLPAPEVAQSSTAKQLESLERLNADQKALEKTLKQNAAEPSRAENRRQLQQALERNLKEQADLKSALNEKQRTQGTQEKRGDQAAKNAAQMEQDMQRARDQIEQAMQKGLENGTLSPELLEKMERIRELLDEVLDPGEKESLRDQTAGEEVEASDLHRAMENLLDKKDGLRQSLENAIRMLEALRETRALRDAAAEVRELAAEQEEVARDIKKADSKPDATADAKSGEKQTQELSELGERQERLNRHMDATLKDLAAMQAKANLNEPMKQALKELDRKFTPEARAEMRAAMEKAEDKLKSASREPTPGSKPESKPEPKTDSKPGRKAETKAAQQSADLAARKMKQMAAEMEKLASKMDKASNKAEVRMTLEESLDFSGWLEAVRQPTSPETRRWGGEEAVREGAVRIAKWLRGRLDKLADAEPFSADVLRREAAALGAAADALSTAGVTSSASRAARERLRVHTQRAARELFKLLDKDQEGDGGSDGDGEGSSDAGGGSQGSSGEESLSGRIKGASGKQAAVNRATQELLKSFLEGRQGKPQGSEPGDTPGSSQGTRQGSGQGSTPGSQPGSASGSTPGSNPGGSSSGDGEGSGDERGGTQGANRLANEQQQISEALESMAESADDAGGAARKLRQLAAEARELEEALRRRTMNPEEIRRRQERFQTRMLEAANALEERGHERERRAEASKGNENGGARPPSESGGAELDENRIRELKRRRDEARKLPLSPEQKRRVEWYYDQLLAP